MNDELSALRAEVELLRRRLELWNTAAEMLHVGVWERDPTTDLAYWSDEMKRIYGFDAAHGVVSGQELLAATHPDDREALMEVVRLAREDAGAKPQVHRHRIVRPSGEVHWIETCFRLERDPAGRRTRLVGTSIDRTAAHRAKEAEVKYQTLVAQASDGIFLSDHRGKYVEVNETGCTMLGYTRDELLGMSIHDLVPPEDLAASPLQLDAVLRGETVQGKRRMRRKDGRILSVELGARMLPDGRLLALTRDVTEREESEKILRESEQTVQEVGANLPALVWVRDAETGDLLYANAGWAQLTGHPPVLGAHFGQLAEAVHPDDLGRLQRATEQAVDGGYDEVVRFVDREGALKWFRMRAFPIRDATGKPYRVAGFAENISEQRAAEERILASLREKEILLKEIHHRVKNNLQIISSLLYLQSTKVDEARVAALFTESQGRVAAMALVHELLYQSSDISRISFGEYVRALGASLLRSYGVDPHAVALVVDACDVVLGVDTAILCGLLLNEILSNALKHAFAGRERGTIRVELRREGEDRLRLVVEDDGIGLPADFEARCRASLGTKLIERLVEQLGGTMIRSASAQGTLHEVRFACDAADDAAAALPAGATA